MICRSRSAFWPLYRATPQGSTEAMNKRGQNVLPQYYDLSARSGHGFESQTGPFPGACSVLFCDSTSPSA